MFTPKSTNLSIAWTELFLKLMERGAQEVSAVGISVTEFDASGLPREVRGVRDTLDESLARLTGGRNRALSIQDVASTIFPITFWNRNSRDLGRHVFERYARVFGRVKARDSRNKRGTYFQRLTAYAPLKPGDEPINQLAHIIKTYNGGNHRRSALLASTFDPRFDHNDSPMLGFPCLQQVAFAPTDSGLTVTGFYPVQYVFERAYGNYLGLCWLGLFMASQLDMPLVEMNCFINVAQLGRQHKTALRELVGKLQSEVKK